MEKRWFAWVCGCLLSTSVACSLSPGNSTDGSPAGGGGPPAPEGGDAAKGGDTATGVAAAASGGGSSGATSTPASGGDGGASAQPGGDAEGATCGAIVACVQGCADDACTTACADRGSSTAQQLFDELVTCLTLYGCGNPACLQLNCAAEADACTGDGQAGGTQDGGAPATGDATLPADLIGQWATSDGSTTYHFNADSTYEYVFHYGSSLACIAYLSRQVTELGTVSVRGDTLTTTGTSRTTETQNCDFSSSTDKDTGTKQTYRYTLSNNALSLTDSKGNTLTLTQP